MHAADVVETLPTALPDEDALAAVRMVAERGLPGLVVADERAVVIACMSSAALLRAVLPPYFLEGACLAQVIDERHADLIAADLADTPVRALIGRVPDAVPRVRAQATAAELGALLARRKSPFALVEAADGHILGVVTANRLLGLLAAAAEQAT
ncbi:hypothetical protein [Streptomyces boninensis]|uniref:hypothetical protein n=1 Tax=Streptomyces boninensis TaxID=2039455 RepID=UPI003B215BFC